MRNLGRSCVAHSGPSEVIEERGRGKGDPDGEQGEDGDSINTQLRTRAGPTTGGEGQQEYLRNLSPPIEQYVMHYSSRAARWHSEAIRGREDEFERYRRTIGLSDVQKIANSVLHQHAIPESLKAETLQRLSRAKMTDSRLALLFHYKTKFQRPNLT